jgi:hypothetical protein
MVRCRDSQRRTLAEPDRGDSRPPVGRRRNIGRSSIHPENSPQRPQVMQWTVTTGWIGAVACHRSSFPQRSSPPRRHWSILRPRKKGRGTKAIVAAQFLDEFGVPGRGAETRAGREEWGSRR